MLRATVTRYNIDLVSKLCTHAVNSTRDCIQILLAFLNQFKLIAMSTVQRSPLELPTALAQGGLGCLEGQLTRDKALGRRHPTRYRDVDESPTDPTFICRKRECCTGATTTAASLNCHLSSPFFPSVRRRAQILSLRLVYRLHRLAKRHLARM